MKTGEWTKNLKTGGQTAKSMIEQVYAVKIPAGTTIYTGPVGYQGGMYFGDWKQIRYFYLILDCQELNFLNIVNKMEVFRKWRN